MAVTVKLCCSECEAMREARLQSVDKEIVCEMCGRKTPNLLDSDFKEIEDVLTRQRWLNAGALLLFVAAVLCLVLWVGPTGGQWAVAGASVEANMGMFAGFLLFGLGALVCGVMGSLKRYVIEF